MLNIFMICNFRRSIEIVRFWNNVMRRFVCGYVGYLMFLYFNFRIFIFKFFRVIRLFLNVLYRNILEFFLL